MCGPGKACHYRVLGLTISAKDSEIKTAYRKAIFKVHPYKLVGASEAKKAEDEAKSKLLNAAWECLSNKISRAQFDIRCAQIPIGEYRFVSPSTWGTAPAPDLSKFSKPSPPSPPKSPQPSYGDAPSPDFSRFENSRKFHNFTAEDYEENSGPPPKRTRTFPEADRGSHPYESTTTGFNFMDDDFQEHPRATPQKKAAPTPKKHEDKRGDNTYEYEANGWTFNIKISSKYHVYDNAEDETTKNMHRICVSLNFMLELDESYIEPMDGTEDPDIILTVTKTPQGRDISGINSLYHYSTGKEELEQKKPKPVLRTFILTLSARKAALLVKTPTTTSFNLQTPIPPPPTALYTATHLVFSRNLPSTSAKEGEPSTPKPFWPKDSPEVRLAGWKALQARTISGVQAVVRFVDLKKEGVKYEMVGEWHRLAATGYRMIPVMPVRDGKGRYDGFDYAFWNAGVKEKEKEKK
jgi:curved DNA-binding protein CbpA